MKRYSVLAVLVILLAWTAPAPAQSIFSKKPKPNPSQRVPELILILQTETDEHKRAHAAAELRDYDAATFTEIVPVLVDVLQRDKKLSVRLEAVNGLVKIRPVNTTAGHALEKAAAADESWRVRMHAKTSLTKYHLAGYSAKTTDALPTSSKKTSQEPPVSTPSAPIPVSGNATPPPPRPLPIAPASSSVPRPLPQGPPAATAPGQGPSLFP